MAGAQTATTTEACTVAHGAPRSWKTRSPALPAPEKSPGATTHQTTTCEDWKPLKRGQVLINQSPLSHPQSGRSYELAAHCEFANGRERARCSIHTNGSYPIGKAPLGLPMSSGGYGSDPAIAKTGLLPLGEIHKRPAGNRCIADLAGPEADRPFRPTKSH